MISVSTITRMTLAVKDQHDRDGEGHVTKKESWRTMLRQRRPSASSVEQRGRPAQGVSHQQICTGRSAG